MTRRTAPVLATLALVGLGVLAAPAAHASTIYPPSDACRVSPGTASAGSTLVFSCAEGTFGADEAAAEYFDLSFDTEITNAITVMPIAIYI